MLVSTRFQVLFHSPPGVLFTFPSRYCSSIGHQVVFRLGWWSTRLPTGFHVSRGTLDHGQLALPFAYRAFTCYGGSFQILRLGLTRIMPVLNPEKVAFFGLGSSPFARRY